MSNEAEDFGSFTKAVQQRIKNKGKVTEQQKVNNRIDAQEEINNSIVLEGEDEAMVNLQTIYSPDISQLMYIRGDSPSAYQNQYYQNEQGELVPILDPTQSYIEETFLNTGEGYKDRLEATDGNINDKIQGEYRQNLNSALLGVASQTLNKQLIEEGVITRI